MSERKVLNKYYPPDFDPSKIPRMKLAKNRQYTVRLMAPFNMRCVTCGEYIYKGKKFNARKEDVEGQDYLGIRIYRFYIKCTRCLQEISFKTDPQNTDYEIEAGATRNFMALKLAEEQAQKEEDERKEDESTNPMKLLENRTKQSKQELELLESLEELRDLNRRQRAVDFDEMLVKFDTKEKQRQIELKQEEEDEKFIRSVFGGKGSKSKIVEEVVEVEESCVSTSSNFNEGSEEPAKKKIKADFEVEVGSSVVQKIESQSRPLISSILSSQAAQTSVGLTVKGPPTTQSHSIGLISKKNKLNSLVRVKKNSDSNGECSSIEKDVHEKKQQAVELPNSESGNLVRNAANSSSGLSLLGSYSGSESD